MGFQTHAAHSVLQSSFAHASAGADTTSTVPTLPGGPFELAGDLLLASVVCAVLYWLLMQRILRRRHKTQPANRGTLFVALFLAAFAASTLGIADSFASNNPLFFLPVAGLFLLFFYRIPGRTTPTWTLWLIFFYGVTQVGPLVPPSPKQQNPQFDQFLATIPGGTHGLLVTAGAFAISVFGHVVILTFILIGILPQLYRRYRALQNMGMQRQMQPHTRAILGAALFIGSFLLLLAAAALALPPSPIHSPVLLGARTLLFFLITLLPIVAAFELLRGRHFDRPAWVNRAFIYAMLSICLILIYIATLGLGFFIPGLLSGLIFLLVALDVPLLIALYPVLQSRIQDLVNRRFFPHESVAIQVLASYKAALRQETHLEQLSMGLVSAVQKAMQSNFVSLWLRTPATLSSPYGVGLAPLPASARQAAAGEQRLMVRLHRQASTDSSHPVAAMLHFAPNDATRTSLLNSPGTVEITQLPEDSPAASALRDDGTMLAVPLLLQGELVGIITLGPRSGAEPYTYDDCKMLTELADAVTLALHIANVTHEQDAALHQQERAEQELQMARRIQESLLPKEVPALAGWQLATCYQPAREVGGDFYDFLSLSDGRLGLVLGDVTDKGIPAALVMATARSMLRAVAMQPAISPGQVLGQVNDLLCQDLPASMFVTCFYAILDPATGQLAFANAGQDWPYLSHPDGTVSELHATGMPLGLLPGSRYEEGETTLTPGDTLLLFSDGLVEAHNPDREMFGLSRLSSVLRDPVNGAPPIVRLLHDLADFTGAGWEQEDDITLVALEYADGNASLPDGDPVASATDSGEDQSSWRTLDAWTLASEPGNERAAIARVAQVVRDHALPLSPARLERLQTAVGEATMNAMEHGNAFMPERLVELVVRVSSTQLAVRITDQGRHSPIPEPDTPDLGAKLAGLQSPRGWGLFLIQELVDVLHVSGDAHHHTVELILSLDDAEHPSPESEET
jgi:serine phosphatase RsbU (regulator of sigma subunit)/anti-sigma regulatory factor (Ser/Thr protein kinase)